MRSFPVSNPDVIDQRGAVVDPCSSSARDDDLMVVSRSDMVSRMKRMRDVSVVLAVTTFAGFFLGSWIGARSVSVTPVSSRSLGDRRRRSSPGSPRR